MLKTDQFSKIGQVLKSNGTDGQVIIRLYSDISEEEPVFIEFDGLPVPFFVTVDDERGTDKFLVHLTDVNCLADAEELSGKALYLPLCPDSGEGFEDFTGWDLFRVGDPADSLVGKVVGLEDIPGNPCLEIVPANADGTKKDTVLVPLHKDLVVDVNEDGRTLVMQIPEGLL